MSYSGWLRQRSILVLAALVTAVALSAGVARAAASAGAPDADSNSDGVFDNLADTRVNVIATLAGPGTRACRRV